MRRRIPRAEVVRADAGKNWPTMFQLAAGRIPTDRRQSSAPAALAPGCAVRPRAKRSLTSRFASIRREAATSTDRGPFETVRENLIVLGAQGQGMTPAGAARRSAREGAICINVERQHGNFAAASLAEFAGSSRSCGQALRRLARRRVFGPGVTPEIIQDTLAGAQPRLLMELASPGGFEPPLPP